MATLPENFEFKTIKGMEGAFYTKYSYPMFAGHMASESDDVYRVAIMENSKVHALALTLIDRETSVGRILSIFVIKESRGRGFADTLLSNVEAELKSQGVKSSRLEYKSQNPSTEIVEHLLEKHGWDGSGVIATTGETFYWNVQRPTEQDKQQEGKLFIIPRADRYELPEEAEIFHWSELTDQDRAFMEDALANDDRYPIGFSPNNGGEEINMLNSMGLRYKGEIAGWVITHQINPTTIRYSNVFMRQDLQVYGCAILLLQASIDLQNEVITKIPNSLFTAYDRHPEMVRFARKRLFPFMDKVSELRYRTKQLS